MTQEELPAKFKAKFPGASQVSAGVKGYLTMKLQSPADLLPVARWLKEELGFNYLDMVTGVDFKEPVSVEGYIADPNPNVFLPEGATPQIEAVVRAPNFPYRDAIEAVYCLSNLDERIKVFLKVELPRQNSRIPSLVALFKAADWQEREAFDLLGIEYEGHPNLTKILTPEFIQGHPLRKDYVHVKDRFD